MVVFFALLLSLLMLVSFEKTSTGIVAASVWAVISVFAFYNPVYF